MSITKQAQQAPLHSMELPNRRPLQIHWLTVVFPLICVVLTITITYIGTASKGYTRELAISDSLTDPQFSVQRVGRESLKDLTEYIVDKVKGEMSYQIERTIQQALKEHGHDLKEDIRRIAQEELSKKEVKHLGIDHASRFSGTFYPTNLQGSTEFKLLGITIFDHRREPEIVIDRVDKPILGLCWPFDGDSGYILLKLKELVRINEVFYMHVDRGSETSSWFKTSPRIIEAWGGVGPDTMKFLGETEMYYNQSTVSIVVKEPTNAQYIKFMVTENNGADYTCLYRVFVYASSITSE